MVTLACICFFLQDVVDPPPEMLLRDFDLYMANVHDASATVMLRYVLEMSQKTKCEL